MAKNKSTMISENQSAHANLPQNVIMRDYPKVSYEMGEGLDDTINYIDHQMISDARGGKHKKGKFPTKY